MREAEGGEREGRVRKAEKREGEIERKGGGKRDEG